MSLIDKFFGVCNAYDKLNISYSICRDLPLTYEINPLHLYIKMGFNGNVLERFEEYIWIDGKWEIICKYE